MEKYIEGDWKEVFEFRMIRQLDIPRVIKHIQEHFYLSTPLTSGLSYSKEYFDEFDKVYLTVIPQWMSFYCLDKRTNEIVGARITFIHNKELDQKLKNFNFQTHQMKIMNQIMGHVIEKANIYERYGINEYVNFFTACVDPKYQGQGIASEMYRRGLDGIRKGNLKWDYLKSNLTSPYTRKICENNGFIELARAYYNDFKDEKTGKPLLSDKKDDEFVAYMVLKLR